MGIVVVDDKKVVSATLTTLLRDHGYSSHTACNGLDAFEKTPSFT